MPLTDPPVYNSCNLLIFLNIKKIQMRPVKIYYHFFTKIM